MKKFVLVAAIAGSLVSGQAIAACTDTRLNPDAIRALLGGNTVCVPAVTVDPMTWQELHTTGGALIDYKRGPNPGPDQSKDVGRWSVNGNGVGNATVTHTYSGGGGSYIYSVHGTGAVGTIHSFCRGGTAIDAKVQLGGGACR